MPALVVVDAFADRPFAGNPAAVCLLTGPADASWMQAVAGEMNLAATAFVWPVGEAFGIRWFSPTRELALCGHATLASAHVLLEQGAVPAEATIRFESPAGQLTACRRGDLIEMDFPAEPSAPAEAPAELLRALGALPVHVERSRMDYVVELASEAAVRAARPDFSVLRGVPARALIVTARSTTAPGDFVSRFFAPSVGIDEDPVTGSAHCCLGPYWERRLGRSDLVGVQVSTRGGVVYVRTDGPRARLGGHAITVLRGTLQVDLRPWSCATVVPT